MEKETLDREEVEAFFRRVREAIAARARGPLGRARRLAPDAVAARPAPAVHARHAVVDRAPGVHRPTSAGRGIHRLRGWSAGRRSTATERSIDWHGGIRETLARLWPDADAEALLRRYHAVERERQDGTRHPVPAGHGGGARRRRPAEGLSLPDGRARRARASLPSWRPFREVPRRSTELRARGWRLGILSNTDPDFLDASLGRIGVRGRPHGRGVGDRLLQAGVRPLGRRSSNGHGATAERHVHVAASLFHDVAPAAELGLPRVWIDRRTRRATSRAPASCTDLSALPEALDALVPG